jgi:translation initiation factor IF-2
MYKSYMATKNPIKSGILKERPPVVVIMGHIDHGKSTLLDYIRKSNITKGEAGGITQHLGAYEVPHQTKEGKIGKITFLDTPGHEAFTGIRTRGAQVADIAVLVVSAEDGVKPQTLEALKCIKSSALPYIVAINKIDRPSANIERTKQSLAENEIYVEGYGGDIPVVPICALDGRGVSDLLDMIILVAELGDFTADTSKNAEGIIIDTKLDTKKGIGATLLIKDGTIKSGMYVVADDAISPVRILEDFKGQSIKEATVTSPVRVIGWSKVPSAGSIFQTFQTKSEAEKVASSYVENKSNDDQNIHTKNDSAVENKITIPIIIKADVIGSLEGIKHEISKLSSEKVLIKIIHAGIGDINEGDTKMASGAQNIIIYGFNVKTDTKARSYAERLNIKIETFDIIYNLIESIKSLQTSNTPKTYIDVSTGKAKILQVFSKVRDKQIVGGKVQEGSIKIGAEVKVLRREIEIGRGKVRELQQQKVKASEVREGFEFGTMIECKIEIAIGDKIEAFETIEEK